MADMVAVPVDFKRFSSRRAGLPAVSVIVPTRNRPNLLTRCLESLASQRFRSFEVILINDGGSDLSELVYKNRGSLDLLLIQTDRRRERSWCRNLGIAFSHGKYVSFLDDDDRYYPDHLKVLHEAAGRSTHVVYSDFYCAQEVPEGDGYRTVSRERLYSHDFDVKQLLAGNFIPICCLLVSREALARAGYFDENLSIYEDWDLLIRLSRHYRFRHLRRTTGEYSVRSDGTNTLSVSERVTRSAASRVLQKHFELVELDWMRMQYGRLHGHEAYPPHLVFSALVESTERLGGKIPQGPVSLYGAGTLGRLLYPCLKQRHGKVAVFDVQESLWGEPFFDTSVRSPRELSRFKRPMVVTPFGRKREVGRFLSKRGVTREHIFFFEDEFRPRFRRNLSEYAGSLRPDVRDARRRSGYPQAKKSSKSRKTSR